MLGVCVSCLVFSMGGCDSDVVCIGQDFGVLTGGCWDVVEKKVEQCWGQDGTLWYSVSERSYL